MDGNQKSSDLENMWSSLDEFLEKRSWAENDSPAQFQGPRHISFPDRLANSFLNGTLPVFLLCVGTTFLASGKEHPTALLGTLCFCFILAISLRCLTCNSLGFNKVRLTILSLPLFTMAPFFFLPRETLVHRIQSQAKDSHSPPLGYSLADSLQVGWEQLFRGKSFLFFALGIGAITVLGSYVRKSFPWVEPQRSKPASIFVALALLLLPCLFVWKGTSSKPEYVTWKESLAPAFEETQAYKLPKDDGTTRWSELYEGYNEAVPGPERSDTSVSVPGLRGTFQELESQVKKALIKSPPSSYQELEKCQDLLSALLQRGDLLSEPLAIEALQASPRFAGVRRGPRVSVWRDVFLPWLSSPERQREELIRAEESLSTILETRLRSRDELDLSVYNKVYGKGEIPVVPVFTIGSSRYSRSKPYIKRWEGKAWKSGTLLSGSSPTEFWVQRNRETLLEAWLDYRISHWDSKGSWKVKEGWEPDSPRSGYFTDELFGQVFNDSLHPLTETALLYVQLRLMIIERGVLPSDLSTLRPDTDRWSLERQDERVVLIDTKRAPFNPDWSF